MQKGPPTPKGFRDIKPEDAKIIAAAQKTVNNLGLESAQMLINDRKNFEDPPQDVIRAIDKLHKVGEKGVKEELLTKNLALDEIENQLFKIKSTKPTEALERIFKTLENDHGLKK